MQGLTFEDMIMDDVKTLIIIDHNHCTKEATSQLAAAVEFGNVWFKNIRGTSATTPKKLSSQIAVTMSRAMTYCYKMRSLLSVGITTVPQQSYATT